MNKLSKLHHDPLFNDIRKYLEESKPTKTLYIFVPYIKTEVLRKMLDGLPNKVVIVTTWNPRDIQYGSSELELYPFCKTRGFSLYINDNLHLKVYSIGLDSAILATGNISHKGLFSNGNHEVATSIEQLGIKDKLYFEMIRRNARLVDDLMHHELNVWINVNGTKQNNSPSLRDIISNPKKDKFLISALPMTQNVDDLISGYIKLSSGNESSTDPEIAACILHDLTNYRIVLGLDEKIFTKKLTNAFFEHPFTQKIDEFIAPEAYFGRIKEWIQDHCTDVPVPSRRELTGNVQVLLEWFEKLGNGRYKIDVPGVRSQRIRKIQVESKK